MWRWTAMNSTGLIRAFRLGTVILKVPHLWRSTIETGTVTIIVVSSLLLFAGVLASKLSSRFGVPALLLFLVLGMLAGSEGPGGIAFDDPRTAMLVGSIALAVILFDGGLQTDLTQLNRPAAIRGVLLASVGVMLTAGVVGAFAVIALGMPLLEGLLLGAILSSTDAAAVFSVLRARSVAIPGDLRTLIEFESASNDPTAVFLTVTLIGLLQGDGTSSALIPLAFAYRLGGGALVGYIAGRGLVLLLNRIELEHDGLYPVLTLAVLGLLFGLAEAAGTSGFMVVYVAGLVLAGTVFVHRQSLIRFHEGMAWLMQITMFLLLGLLVFPSEIRAQALTGLAVSAVLVLVARPLAVFACLLGSGYTTRERLLVSWVGLRGAAPIILATFPMVAGLSASDALFNTVFFAVVISVLVQGPTAGLAARLLRLAEPSGSMERVPIEVDVDATAGIAFERVLVEQSSRADGERLLTVGGPHYPLVFLLRRGERYYIPTGSTVLLAGDELHLVGSQESVEAMRPLLTVPLHADE